MFSLEELGANLGFRILQWRYGNSSSITLSKRIAGNFKKSLDEINDKQLKDLIYIVEYAYHNSAFYKKHYDKVGFRPGDIKDFSDFNKLPEISRDDIRESINNMLCSSIPANKRFKASSGGTTGTPLEFYRDWECINFRRGIDLAVFQYYGWHIGQWQGWLWGATKDLIYRNTLKSRLIQKWGDRTYFLDLSMLDIETSQKFAWYTNRYSPSIISAYPSIAAHLAERVEKGEIDKFHVPVITVTAEPLYEFQRQTIESNIADNVYQRYGSREIGTAAFECPEKNGMHIICDSVYIESLASNTNNSSNTNSLIITDLVNKAMPLIRYRIGDLADIDYKPCSCGLNLPKVTNVSGREVDLVWRKNGSAVAGIKFVTIIRLSEIKAKVQIIQEDYDRFSIKLEYDPMMYRDELEYMKKEIIKLVGNDVRVDFIGPVKLIREKSGKYRYVISRVNKPGGGSNS